MSSLIVNQGFQSPIGGRDAPTVSQQTVQIQVPYDQMAVNTLKMNTQSGDTLYPQNGAQVFDIVKENFLFWNEEIPYAGLMGDRPVFASTNGSGAGGLVKKYKDNLEVARLKLKEKLIPVGISVSVIHNENSIGQQSLTAGVSGAYPLKPDSDIAPADLLVFETQHPNDISRYRSMKQFSKGEPEEKIKPILIKYNPENFRLDYLTTRNAILNSKTRDEFNSYFTRSVNPDSLISAKDECHASVLKSQLASFIFGLYHVMTGVGSRFLLDGDFEGGIPQHLTMRNEAYEVDNVNQFAKDLCSILAVGFGLVKDTDNETGLRDNSELADTLENLRRDMLNGINNAEITNYRFDTTTKSIEGLKSGNSTRDVLSQMIMLQYNHDVESSHSRNLLVDLERKYIVAKCLHGAKAGEYGYFFLLP
jgi:hypothetical protein